MKLCIIDVFIEERSQKIELVTINTIRKS